MLTRWSGLDKKIQALVNFSIFLIQDIEHKPNEIDKKNFDKKLDPGIQFSNFVPSGSEIYFFSTSDSDSSWKTVYIATWERLESQIWPKSLRNPDPGRNLVFSYQMHRVYLTLFRG